jgi:orotidine-5'-phosphate decarboxylase
MSEIVIALDFPSQREALALVDTLEEQADYYKVGLELYTREGPGIIRALKGRGKRVFLDLKLFDIPNTVSRAVRSAAALGADMLTVHAAGGRAMLQAAADGAGDDLAVIAVTLLTSLTADEVEEVWDRAVPDLPGEVLRLAVLAREAGLEGVVASAQEARAIRDRLGPDALIVTPGIRMAGGEHHDQARVTTPAQAVTAGASHLVVGRAVTQAPDPVAAMAAVVEQTAGGA